MWRKFSSITQSTTFLRENIMSKISSDFSWNFIRIFGSVLLIPHKVGAENLTPPPPVQKWTRLWLAKIHSRLSYNITPLIISHIHYGGGGGGG